MKNGKKFLATLLAFAVAITCLVIPAAPAQAATEPSRFDADGLFFGTPYYTFDKMYVDADGTFKSENQHYVYLNKLRLVKHKREKGDKYDYYPTGQLELENNHSVSETAEIIAVKSNSKNLKCIVSYASKYNFTYNDNPPVTHGYTTDSTVSVMAKKAGTYTVTITVKLDNNKIVNKVAYVKVDKNDPIEIVPDKKKLTTDNTYDAKKIKVKIKKGSQISGVECYYSNSAYGKAYTDKNGYVSYPFNHYKKFRSGASIPLHKKYSSSYSKKYDSYTHSYTDNYWYARTTVRVIYKDTFLGINSYTEKDINRYRKIK